jgi:hypothetical protein
MSESDELGSNISYAVSSISSRRTQELLSDMPTSEVRRRQLNLGFSALRAYVDLAEDLSGFMGQPLDTAIINRYEQTDHHHSRQYRKHRAGRFSGRLAVVSLSGVADLTVYTDRDKRREECTAGTVIIFDAGFKHKASVPRTPQPRYELILGHDLTERHNN